MLERRAAFEFSIDGAIHMALSLQLGLIDLAVILVFAVRPATAQTFQFLPEVDPAIGGMKTKTARADRSC